MKVSVTLANYNHGQYLETYFAGIRCQTHQNWELIVTDDGSTDDSVAIIQRHAAEDRRIKLYRFKKNRGSMPAFQNCYKRVTGKLVYATASDDYVLDPNFFAKAVKAFEWQPRLGLYFGTEEIRDATSGQLYRVDGRAPQTGYIPPERCIAAFLAKELLIPGCTAMVRKACIDKFGGFPADLGANCDYYLNHAIAAKYGVHHERDLVAYARVDLKRKNLSLQMSLAQRLHNTFEIVFRFRRDGLLKTISEATLRQWLVTEVRHAISIAHDGVWSMKSIRELHRKIESQRGLSDRFLKAGLEKFLEEVEREENTIATTVVAEVTAFENRISSIVPDFSVGITESSVAGVTAFLEQRPDLKGQISARLSQYAKSLRKFSKIVIYGAGTHSSVLLREWRKRELPEVSAVTTTDANGGGGEFEGLPIVSLESLNQKNQLIVLSSLSFENSMYSALQTRVRPSAVLSIWNPGFTNL